MAACVFADAEFHDTRFRGSTEACSFANAVLHGCQLLVPQLKHCNLRESAWQTCTWQEIDFYDCSLLDVQFTDGLIDKAAFRECLMSGFRLDGSNKLHRILLSNIDLRQVDASTARLLYDAAPGAGSSVRWPSSVSEPRLA